MLHALMAEILSIIGNPFFILNKISKYKSINLPMDIIIVFLRIVENPYVINTATLSVKGQSLEYRRIHFDLTTGNNITICPSKVSGFCTFQSNTLNNIAMENKNTLLLP
jgi:hypothetical protein